MMSWSLFSALVVIVLLKRIMDIWGTVTPRDCDETVVHFLGPTPALDGPLEWFVVIALLAIVLLVIQAAERVLAGAARLTFWLIWAVNVSLCALLLAAYALTWAYFNPGEPLAKPIFQVATTIQPPQAYVMPEPMEPRVKEDYFDWKWDEDGQLWINEAFGLVQRHEVVRICKQAEFKRAQLKLIYGERTQGGRLIDELDDEYLESPLFGDVLYDLDDNYLVTLGGLYEKRSSLTRRRDAAYDPDKAAMSPEEAERRYFEWVDTLFVPQPAPRPQPLTREQIDRIVAESWGDERPAWHEDD